MEQKALSKNLLFDTISVLPKLYQQWLKGCIHCKKGRKYDPLLKDFVRGQYLSGRGKIVIYGFTEEEINQGEYVDIIFHEIAHKIFQEILTRKKKADWAKARVGDFPIKLDDVYLEEELWEEEYCIIFSLIMAFKFYKKFNMDAKAKKIGRGLKKISEKVKVVRETLKNPVSSSDNPKSHGDYPQKIHSRILKWIANQ